MLQERLRRVLGDMTFAEAYQRSGRILNVSVSAADTREPPRLLNYLTGEGGGGRDGAPRGAHVAHKEGMGMQPSWTGCLFPTSSRAMAAKVFNQGLHLWSVGPDRP